jgi:cation diffusion facilitator CzcD-associated flavoprotein CzcO
VIIGSGFAGLGMGIRLRLAGRTDFVILEQADHVGGTWRDNHYPGAACDIESHLYSFSFEPNPSWSRTFAVQAEILAYLDHCADKYGLRSHLRLSCAATAAAFDEASGLWSVTTSDGDTLRPRIVISCCGGLSRPSAPDLAGLETLAGKLFHSARWDGSYPIAGKTVAVIGTGASAIQIVPSIAPAVAQLHLFQRTAPWILPKRDRAISDAERDRFRRFPVLQQLARIGQYLRHELTAVGFIRQPGLLRLAEGLVRRYLAASVRDPILRQQLQPNYRLGCKRILLSNDYYPALQRENVELVGSPIREVRPHSIVTSDGNERPIDALILATGFQAAEQAAPFAVHGRDGQSLDAVWQAAPEAYLGTTVAGFPNLFLIVGPNTGLGHSSMVFMIESQIAFIESALALMAAQRLKFVDVRPEEQASYNTELQARFPHTVWKTGCVSWYQTRSGKNTTLWPGSTIEFRLRTRDFDPGPFELAPL